MNGRGLRRIGLVVAICATAGALAGIAGSAAAPTKKQATAAQKKAVVRAKQQLLARRGRVMRFGFGLGFGGGPMGGPVHSETVVPNKDGTGFVTITSDGGTLNKVDGTTVHLKEGTDKATYDADKAIDVGSDATVFRNGAKAALTDLQPGDHVHVLQTPKGNFVMAADDAFIAKQQQEHKRFFRGFRHHEFGPGDPPPPGAPGPPPPGAPGTYPG